MSKPSVFKKLNRDELRQKFEKARLMQRRELVLIMGPAVLLALGALALAYQFVEPAPPRKIVMSTGSEKGAFHGFGKRYAEILARDGVTLELKPSDGSRDNAARLTDPKSGVMVALVQGGAVDRKSAPELASLGQVYQQPLWIFYRYDTEITKLTGFKGKRLSIGPKKSGTRALVTELLDANNLTEVEGPLLDYENDEAATRLIDGQLDAIFIATAADSPVIKRLLGSDGADIRLLSLENAEAYTRRFPHLGKVTLPQGVIDLENNVPSRDYVLLSPQASLLVREDLHPAIIGILVNAAREVHSEGGLFQRVGEYPVVYDPSIPMSEEALRVYSSGNKFLFRYLPFWVATFIERMLVMVVPIATILLPLIKIVPWLYQYRIKSRLLHWFNELKKIERQLTFDRSVATVQSAIQEVERIEEAVAVIPVPVAYSVELYDLKAAIDLVRQRITAKA